jgi:hypothetical protein
MRSTLEREREREFTYKSQKNDLRQGAAASFFFFKNFQKKLRHNGATMPYSVSPRAWQGETQAGKQKENSV